MRIERVDLTDTARIRACHTVYEAVLRADKAEGPWLSAKRFGGWLTVGWLGDPREVWLVTDQAASADEASADEASADEASAGSAGAVAGWYWLELPDRGNLDRAQLELLVHPDRRRRGLGRPLLQHAIARASANGRSVLNGVAQNGSAGQDFARSAGAQAGLVDVQRVLDLADAAAARLADVREQAMEAAAGYSLVSWTGPVPEEFLEQAAALYTALGDAPHDAGEVPPGWDAQQVRERTNDLLPRFGMRQYSIAARCDASGEMAALTQLAVDPEDPGWGHQLITAVTRKHRGHRLGLLVKAAMLDLLATTEPQLERISTWNAEANQHMIAVNQALGYAVLGPPNTVWRLDAN
ncbi:MAG: GNAT family N-acetyltransferase [Actinomycetota bacterium]|nr:GNAT family N-acetyltransferase [Actinomycetota bacterium]